MKFIVVKSNEIISASNDFLPTPDQIFILTNAYKAGILIIYIIRCPLMSSHQ